MIIVYLNSLFKLKMLGCGLGGGFCVVLLNKIFYLYIIVKFILINYLLVS